MLISFLLKISQHGNFPGKEANQNKFQSCVPTVASLLQLPICLEAHTPILNSHHWLIDDGLRLVLLILYYLFGFFIYVAKLEIRFWPQLTPDD